MKVAFATQDLKRVDAHFGWAKNIAIYDVTPGGHVLLKAIEFEGDLKEDGNDDKLAPKIEAIKDCAILYVAAIGGAGAARVVANKIHPIKVNKPESILVLLEKLERVLKGTPPPWLRKAMIEPGGCNGFKYKMGLAEEPNPDDAVIECDGLKVFVDNKSREHLIGTTIDFVMALEGSGFMFHNPNATANCSCGKSFG